MVAGSAATGLSEGAGATVSATKGTLLATDNQLIRLVTEDQERHRAINAPEAFSTNTVLKAPLAEAEADATEVD